MKYFGELFHAAFPFPLPSSAVGDVILVISRDISKKGRPALALALRTLGS